MNSSFPEAAEVAVDAAPPPPTAIGELIRDARNLSADDIDRIARFQADQGLRFGEAAIALGLADTEDVLRALARQYRYAYADEAARRNAPELVVLNQPFGHQAECFRALRSQVLMRTQADGRGVNRPLALVSPEPGDGKTYCCANLAVALAQLGGRVLIVDADLRGARMDQLFGLDARHGLSAALSGRGDQGLVQRVPGVPNLHVIPVGALPPNPLELAEGPAFGALLRELAGEFDHVLVDTPAGVHGMDGVVVASRCGAALVVARKNVNRLERLQHLVGQLQDAHVRVVGVTVNEY